MSKLISTHVYRLSLTYLNISDACTVQYQDDGYDIGIKGGHSNINYCATTIKAIHI